MSMANKLPSVLTLENVDKSLSTFRVLKQAIQWLEIAEFDDSVDEHDFQVILGNLKILAANVD